MGGNGHMPPLSCHSVCFFRDDDILGHVAMKLDWEACVGLQAEVGGFA